MAGVSTPEFAVGAREMIADVRALSTGPFNVNVFVDQPVPQNVAREKAWLSAMAPLFDRYGARPPAALRPIYTSFIDDDDEMLALLIDTAPAVVSFHLSLPDAGRIRALKDAGCMLLATAITLDEALAAKTAGFDAVVAQGWEAGGHRGIFDPDAPDDRLGTMALTRLRVQRCGLPVIAAGGIMDGQGICATLDLGAIAAQLGTAFVACLESSADAAYREALAGPAAMSAVMTSAISGRPAWGLPNRFTQWGESVGLPHPGYPRLMTQARR